MRPLRARARLSGSRYGASVLSRGFRGGVEDDAQCVLDAPSAESNFNSKVEQS